MVPVVFKLQLLHLSLSGVETLSPVSEGTCRTFSANNTNRKQVFTVSIKTSYLTSISWSLIVEGFFSALVSLERWISTDAMFTTGILAIGCAVYLDKKTTHLHLFFLIYRHVHIFKL